MIGRRLRTKLPPKHLREHRRHDATGVFTAGASTLLGLRKRRSARRGRTSRAGSPRHTQPGETATVVRVPLAALADPANRLRVGHPSGYIGAAFIVSGLLVWGFTAGILSALLDRGGWARPWDTSRILDLERAWSTARADRQEVAGP